MESPDKIIEKIESGAVKVPGAKNPHKKNIKKIDVAVQSEGSAHQVENAHAGTEQPDEAKVEAEANAPTEIKVATFPIKGTINKYGFIGVNRGICNALGLEAAPEGAKSKLAADTPIEFSAYDQATRTLTIKILQ